MIHATLRGFEKPTEEDAYCLVDLVVKDICNRNAEEAVH